MNLFNWSVDDIRLFSAVVSGILISWISEGVALCFIHLRELFWDRSSKRKGDKHGSE